MLSPYTSFISLNPKELISAYMSEIHPLEEILKQPNAPDILNNIINYRDYMDSKSQMRKTVTSMLDELNDGNPCINILDSKQSLKNIIATAHFAGCCIILEKLRLDKHKLEEGSFVTYLEEYLSKLDLKSPTINSNYARRLHGVDTVRVVQLLRGMGLITRDNRHMIQLGLGAATGIRDIVYTHTEPVAIIESCAHGDQIRFSSMHKQAKEVIVTDLDERHLSTYKQFPLDSSFNAYGYVGNTLELMDKLKAINIPKRNLVTIFRLEPAMIPNPEEFFVHLQPLLAKQCDFIMTIGLGDSPSAFEARINAIKTIHSYLESSGLEPITIKLHPEGTILEQARSLQYGNPNIASYELIYCQL